MSTPTTPALQSEASKIVGLIYTLGVAAASIFVKNPAHVQTAGNIVSILNQILPELESLL